MIRFVFVCVTIASGLLLAGVNSAQAQFGPVIWQQPAPVIWQQPSQIVVQRPPVVVSQMPVASVYRAPIITYPPTRQVVTRQRPILGGTVVRSRTGYQRIAF